MSEQTANLCTTDAAESLRAVVAERDREIERLNSDYNEACEDAMCVARELERQKMNCLNLLQQLEDLKAQHEQDAQTIKVLQAMARQLKAEIEAKKWQADQN